MSHSELAIAGFYDHEQEKVRRAPDWGGDELFTATVPRRRRFERSHHPTRRREPDEHAVPGPADLPDARAAAPVAAAAARAPSPSPSRTPAAAAREADRYLEPVPAGRRTVTITGRPGALAVPPARALAGGPRRRGRTLDERLAHRPERIAAWTCALGLLLILLALITAH